MVYKNDTLELLTFGVIVEVSPTQVKWKGLTLEEPALMEHATVDVKILKTFSFIFQLALEFLKGTLTRDILHTVLKSKLVPQPPDPYPKAVLNLNSNSPRYSNSKQIPRCGPPPRGI